MQFQHKKTWVWKQPSTLFCFLQSFLYLQVRHSRALNSINCTICMVNWFAITFQLKQTCCWEQFLDIFYRHMNRFCIHKVQQDFHSRGCQPLDIHIWFIFFWKLQIKSKGNNGLFSRGQTKNPVLALKSCPCRVLCLFSVCKKGKDRDEGIPLENSACVRARIHTCVEKTA